MRALKATGIHDYNVCAQNHGHELDKAESLYPIKFIGLLNKWLKEHQMNEWAQSEDTLDSALEFLVKSAPVV